MAAATAGGCLALALAGCAHPIVSPFSAGAVDQRSTVAADVDAAARSPGPYPEFNNVPPVPRDVRPVPAWRAAVVAELSQKKQLEAETAAIPFVLSGTELWAKAQRAKIPPSEMLPVSPDEAAESEAYANQQRVRATPPPAPQ